MINFLSLFIIISFISCAPATVYRTPHLSTTAQSKKIYYFVKKGDSLWTISRKYGISVNEIMRENKISSSRNLKVGQRIIISPRLMVKGVSFHWPVKGEVLNYFNESVNNSINKGINIKVNPGDNKVNASAKGKVVFADHLKGWGKTLILKHDNSLYTIYANLDKTLLGEGAFAKKGQVIGNIASASNGNRVLHFEVRKKHLPQNPLAYLN